MDSSDISERGKSTFSGLTLKNIAEDVTIVVIINKELADCYRTWFKFIWEHCLKEK